VEPQVTLGRAPPLAIREGVHTARGVVGWGGMPWEEPAPARREQQQDAPHRQFGMALLRLRAVSN